MTKIISQNKHDINIITESLYPTLTLIFGGNHPEEQNQFIEIFNSKVKLIEISQNQESYLKDSNNN